MIEDIVTGIKLLFKPGQLVEIRGKRLDGTIFSKFFTDHDRMARVLAKVDEGGEFEAIWYTVQELKLDLNWQNKQQFGLATNRDDIKSYQWLIIDIDRPKGDPYKKYNATEAEVAALAVVRDKVIAYLKLADFPDPVIACSGNGWHLLYRLPDLPVTEHWLIRDVLNAVAHRFRDISGSVEDAKVCAIDTSLSEPEQIIKAYGTKSRKSPLNEGERKWRQSHIHAIPRPLKWVSHVSLQLIAGDAPTNTNTLNKSGDRPEVNPDWVRKYGPHDLFQFGGKYTPCGGEYEKNGETHYVMENCFTATEDGLHQHSGDKRKTEFILGDSFGMSCFSDDCGEMKISEVLDKLEALVGKPYPHRKMIFALSQEELENSLDALGAEEANEENEKPTAPADAEKKTGLYPMPESCMYGYLGELARKLQSPLGFAYPAVLAVYAGRWGTMRTKSVRSNIYVCLLADIHEGKSRTIKRADHVIAPSDASKTYSTLTGSDAGLVEMLGGKKDSKIDVSERFGMPRLIIEDEMQDAMNKMDIKGSSLPNKLNKLWSDDEVKHTVKKNDLTAYAQLSILGGLTISGVQDFTEMWGKNTVSGLYDRFLFCVAPAGWEFDDLWEEEEQVKPEEWRPAAVKVDREIFAMKDAWVKADKKSRARLGELALRVAVITTGADAGGAQVQSLSITDVEGESGFKQERNTQKGADGYAHVTPECMKAALEFVEWQEAIRGKYKPSKADTPGGKLAELIVEDFKRCKTKDAKYAWVSWRDRYRKNNWYRKDGKAMKAQRDALVDAGELEAEYETITDKDGIEKRKQTGNFRYNDAAGIA